MRFVAGTIGLLIACALVAASGSSAGGEARGADVAAGCKLGGIRFTGRYTAARYTGTYTKNLSRNPRMCFTLSANRRSLREWAVPPCSARGAPRIVLQEPREAYPPGIPISAQGFLGRSTYPIDAVVDGVPKYWTATFSGWLKGRRASGTIGFRGGGVTRRLMLQCEWSARQVG